MRSSISLFVATLLAGAAPAPGTIEGATAPDWSSAMRACHQHPDHSGCVALISRYMAVMPRVQGQMRQEMRSNPKMTIPMVEPDPSVIDRVMRSTEHMALDRKLGLDGSGSPVKQDVRQ